MHSKTLHENASRPKNRIVNGSRETRPLFVSPSRFGGSAEVCLRERVARKLLAGVLPLGDLAAVNAEIRSGRFALRHKTIDRPRELESNPNGSLNTAEVCAFTRQVHVPYVYNLSQQHFFFFFRRDQHCVRQEVARHPTERSLFIYPTSGKYKKKTLTFMPSQRLEPLLRRTLLLQ